MKLNFKVRFRNKTWLVMFIPAVVNFVYRVVEFVRLAKNGELNQEFINETIFMLISILIMLGVVVDPTTPGLDDSELVMSRAQKPGPLGGEPINMKEIEHGLQDAEVLEDKEV